MPQSLFSVLPSRRWTWQHGFWGAEKSKYKAEAQPDFMHGQKLEESANLGLVHPLF